MREIKLNLGSGKRKLEGFINIDNDPSSNPDILLNLKKGLPFKDNSIDYIYSAHFFEHLKLDDFAFILNEIYRVAKDGCILELKLPFDHIGTRTFMPHHRTFGFHSFDALNIDAEMDDADRIEYFTKLKVRRLDKKPNLFYRFFFYIFPFLKDEIEFKFEVVKR